MSRPIRWTAIAALVTGLAIQLIRPERSNPPTDPARTIAARLPVPPDAARVLDRSCRDCHSNDTRWPWYSHVAPVSWFVADHVNHGRSHFNYSDWAQYDEDTARRLLKNTCSMARKDDMPLSSYLRLHADARLSDADVASLCDWTDAVLRRSRR
jgi:hypothetical protein